MALSFLPKLLAQKTFNISPSELYKKFDKLAAENSQWCQEAQNYLFSLLQYQHQIDASDLDLGGPGCGGKIWYRVYGTKSPAPEFGKIDELESAFVVLSILNKQQKERFYKNKSLDFSFSIKLHDEDTKETRFRGTIYLEQSSLAANFRKINTFVFPIESLGFAEPIVKRLNLQYEKFGLTLVTGLTGSGKSTTLDSIIDMNNHSNNGHIVIVGNPIEYIHTSEKCIVRHREVGTDVISFQKGIIESLRQDPDIVVIGEIRDADEIATLLEITDSGHKTFSTLHTNSAIDSLNRIIAEFPPREQDRIRIRLAETLSIVISQKLVPGLDGKLVLAKEILAVDSSVRAAIINKNIGEIYQMITEGSKKGMITMEQDLANLLNRRKISLEAALNYANNKKRLKQLISR
ncbi:MAG: twitching motility protein PilT [Candidatus Cloacimonadota bacterium]|jgi:twitching motility protein PilT|nr:twitching motility protein PilT [Candidatus Cloacimonadota bacterium]